MDNVTIGFIGLGIGLFFIALRVPIGVALGSVSFVGIAAIVNARAAWGMLTAVPFNFVGDWNLTAIPMFLLMGYVAEIGRASCRERVCQSVEISVVAVPVTEKENLRRPAERQHINRSYESQS